MGEPLRSQFQEGSIGVVQKLVLREHKLVWNSLARTWYGPGQVQFCHVDVAGGIEIHIHRHFCPKATYGEASSTLQTFMLSRSQLDISAARLSFQWTPRYKCKQFWSKSSPTTTPLHIKLLTM